MTTTYTVALPRPPKCYPLGHSAARFGLTPVWVRRTIRSAAILGTRYPGGIMCAAAHSNKLQALNAAETETASASTPSAAVTERARLSRRTRQRPSLRRLVEERRLYPRLPLQLTVRVKRVDGRPQAQVLDLATTDISCSGICFLSENKLQVGAPIDLEVLLAEQPAGRPGMKMFTAAHVVRVEPADTPGWFAVAAIFLDITFDHETSADVRGTEGR